MKIEWLVSDAEYDPAEFPEGAEHLGREEVGPHWWANVVREECLGVWSNPDSDVSVQLSDGGWIEPTTAFRIVP